MAKKKIFNDPVYGFVSFPTELIYDLIDHRYFQRLRRISQLGLTHYVYPGALHTRFHHALGALHLMTEAIQSLRDKGVGITDEEYEAVCIAILLHDIGHGPFSHALEHSIINLKHEYLSELFMEKLNAEFDGQLTMSISIFKGEYPKFFLHELVSSQLDMDRMDYLIRDSFFTGVAEGVIGYDRIIKMLNVKDQHLVVEEKGIYSIEKFIVARRLMYWQVYLHKTVLSAEQMLIAILKRAKKLMASNVKVFCSERLNQFLTSDFSLMSKDLIVSNYIDAFSELDDVDIMSLIKLNTNHSDFVLSYTSKCLLERKLFKIYLQDEVLSKEKKNDVLTRVADRLNLDNSVAKSLILEGKESNLSYNSKKEEIRILQKNGEVKSLSDFHTEFVKARTVTKFYMCFPPMN
ncbi:MAG: HD domain-containing protein [Saprospiraceae bacterium]|nr:HD domain-containing protein [Saprospiraceae bacterium]